MANINILPFFAKKLYFAPVNKIKITFSPEEENITFSDYNLLTKITVLRDIKQSFVNAVKRYSDG